MIQISIWVKITILVILLMPLACNMPGFSSGKLPTATPLASGIDPTLLVMTYAAQLTQNAPAANPAGQSIPGPNTPTPTKTSTQTVTPTATVTPTVTPTPTKTQIPIPCNAASFVSDITFPDDAVVVAGASFIKTWRMKNSGTCDWTSGYKIIFDHGDQMNGPSEVTFTGGVISPGNTVDISVSLKAPTTENTYQGFFRLKSPDGQIFGIGANATGAFWVKVQATKVEIFGLPHMPDLVISSISRDGQCSSGCPFNVTVKVKNNGDAEAENFVVAWWGSYLWTGSKSPNCSWVVSSLATGASKSLTCVYSYPESMIYAIPKSKAIADWSKVIDESDEGNNSLTK